MNKKPLPPNSYVKYLAANQEKGKKVKAFLDSDRKKEGNSFRIPVLLVEEDGPIGPLKAYVGFEPVEGRKFPLELDFLDTRMGMGLRMRARNALAENDGICRAYLTGKWNTEFNLAESPGKHFLLRNVQFPDEVEEEFALWICKVYPAKIEK